MPRYKRWPIHEARDKLCEVIREAIHDGPQYVTRHSETVVIVSKRYFRNAANRLLKAGHPLPPGWLEALQPLPKTRTRPRRR